MDLIRHRTEEGTRYGVVTYRGRKWMKVHYVAHAAPRRMLVTEERYINVVGPLQPKQRRRFNQSVVRAGGKRGAI
ncbi:MAG: hypothetical protein PVI97_00265 [Candidatus Thiodiazotropha sp.]|jgi:hypothetical protein